MRHPDHRFPAPRTSPRTPFRIFPRTPGTPGISGTHRRTVLLTAALTCAALVISACSTAIAGNPIALPAGTQTQPDAAQPDPGASTHYGDTSGLPDGVQFKEPAGGHVVTGDGLALIRATVPGTDDDGDETDIPILLALDTQTRSVRWISDPGIDTDTRPAVIAGVGVAVKAKSGTALNGGEDDALAILSADDGSVISTVAGEHLSTLTFLAFGDVLAMANSHDDAVRGFTITDDGIDQIWETSTPIRSGPWRVGGYIVARLPTDDDDSDADLWGVIDPETGETVSTATVDDPDGDLYIVSPLRGGLLAAGYHDTTVLFHVADDGTLTGLWRNDNDDIPDDAAYSSLPLRYGVYDDGLVVGWSHDNVTAFSAADGSAQWTYEPTSFQNNEAAIAVAGGQAFIGPFGGAWMETVDATGEGTVYDDAPTSTWGELKSFTRVGEHTVLALGSGSDDAPQFFAFLDG